MTYEMFDDEDVTIENEGNLFGINWLDEDGFILDCEWFATEEERQYVIDKWYADNDKFTPEQ